MEEKQKLLERMAARYYEGIGVEQILEEELGLVPEEDCQEYRRAVREFFRTAGELEERYREIAAPMAVFMEIDRVCAGDLPRRFRMLSDLKFLNGMQNLELGRETLKAQGLDVNFLKKTMEKSRQEELAMAEDADLEEIEALQEELSAMLEATPEKLGELLAAAEGQEGWEAVLARFQEAAETVDSQVREDLAILAAALQKAENPDIPMGELVRTAAYEEALELGMNLCILDLAILGTGMVSNAAGLLTGIGFLEELGFLLLGGGTVLAGALILAASGWGAYYAAKELAPYGRAAWEAGRRSMGRAARAVKRAVASVIGFVSNEIFRPAIWWIRDTAMPVIREKVAHPLRRRLARMLEWLGGKAQQVKDFLKNAAAWEDSRGEASGDEGGQSEKREQYEEPEMLSSDAREEDVIFREAEALPE